MICAASVSYMHGKYRKASFAVRAMLARLDNLLVTFLDKIMTSEANCRNLFVFRIVLTSVSLVCVFCFFEGRSRPVRSWRVYVLGWSVGAVCQCLSAPIVRQPVVLDRLPAPTA